MIAESLPDIPRLYTALAEWGACVVYLAALARRWSWWRLVLVPLLGLVAIVVVQGVAGELPIALWAPGMLVAAVVMAALLRFGLELRSRATGFILVRAFVLAELVASLHWQLRSYLEVQPGPVAPWLEVALFVAVHAGGFGLAGLIEARNLPRDEPLDVDARELVVAAAIALVTFAVSNLSFVDAETPFSGRLGPEIFYIRTLVDLCGFVALLAQQQQRQRLGARAETAAVNALLRSHHEQYLQSKRTLEEIDRKQHDMQHWITAIRAEADPQRRAGYLDELQDTIAADALHRRTGSSALDIMLAAKSAHCAEQGVQLTVVADGSLLDFLSVIDLASIIGNALDNAIEATVRLEQREERVIRLAVWAQHGLVMLRVENTYDGRMRMVANRPATLKPDRARHGYGLKNIELAAERYGGTATHEAGERWFTLRVLLPMPGR